MRLGRNVVTALFGWVLLVSMGFVSGAQADTTTDTVGGSGGKPFVANCKPGEALVGIVYNSDDQMYAVGALCRPVADGAFSGPIQKVENVFGLPANGHGNDPSVCPDDAAVRQIYVFVTERLHVHHVRLLCYPISGSGQGFIVKQTVAAGTVTTHSSPGCPSRDLGNYASGLIGSYGTGILSLGLRCHSPQDESTKNTDTGDNNTDSGDNNTADTDTGDDTTITIQITPPDLTPPPKPKPGPSGKIRVAHDATTIYAKPAGKEIAYLEAGDKVSIVTCENNGRGWCQISKPAKGYVWGDDLDE